MIFKYPIEDIRKDFPILKKNIIYMDSACMTLKPRQVIDKLNEYYTEYTACAGRSFHQFSEKVETELQKSRNQVKTFINAQSKEIIFTRNTTESINLIAHSLKLKKGDEIITSDKEHNSNLIPWLKLKEKGIKVKIIESNPDNTFNLNNFEKAFTKNTKLVSVVHTSNLDGVTNPIKEISRITHKNNALLLVDAAQSAPHTELDVKKLDIDFLAFSGHKMLGPTGIGVLYGKTKLLEKLDTFLLGGDTVIDSTYENYKLESIPQRFEAGLQDYAGIIALKEALTYLKKIGLKNINKHEIKLNKIITDQLNENVQLIGPKDPEKRCGIFSFNIKKIDPHHISKILDTSKNILTRSGAHCVHSWFNKHNLKGSVRASLYLYNTEEEASIFAEEIKKISKLK